MFWEDGRPQCVGKLISGSVGRCTTSTTTRNRRVQDLAEHGSGEAVVFVGLGGEYPLDSPAKPLERPGVSAPGALCGPVDAAGGCQSALRLGPHANDIVSCLVYLPTWSSRSNSYTFRPALLSHLPRLAMATLLASNHLYVPCRLSKPEGLPITSLGTVSV